MDKIENLQFPVDDKILLRAIRITVENHCPSNHSTLEMSSYVQTYHQQSKYRVHWSSCFSRTNGLLSSDTSQDISQRKFVATNKNTSCWTKQFLAIYNKTRILSSWNRHQQHRWLTHGAHKSRQKTVKFHFYPFSCKSLQIIRSPNRMRKISCSKIKTIFQHAWGRPKSWHRRYMQKGVSCQNYISQSTFYASSWLRWIPYIPAKRNIIQVGIIQASMLV